VTATIRRAGRGDVEALDAGLRALSAALGDAHRATAADLLRDGFGPRPAFAALIAETQGLLPAGVALFSPLYSTTRGGAGAYVSDLWVAEALRGAGLGARLLAAARDEAAALWGARFLRLGVYARTPRARAFYDRLGFAESPDERYLTLAGPALDALGP
jgi:GNAT superfamily N-acetyltransferase